MKISEKKLRNVFANIFIAIMLFSLSSLTTFGQVTSVFSSAQKYSAIYKGNTNNNNISLMFNVYQGTEYIDKILEKLKEYDAKATFFVGGCWAIKNSEALQKIFDAGHEIGNHGYWHKDHKTLSAENNYSEMSLTHKVIKQMLGYTITLFAPPSGSYGTTCLSVANQMGYKTIMWSKDTIDWRDQDKNLIVKRATQNASNGDLILMHPTKCTLDALGEIISFYIKSGYKLTTVSQNIL